MPSSPEYRARYPSDWALRSRFVRFYRARNRCEWCGVPNYAVGQRIDGIFVPIRGNIYLDRMEYRSSYDEACQVADHANEWNDETHRYIVIVLTVAHIHDDRPEAASLLNLAALCQQCHNRLDAPARRRRRNEHRRSLNPQLELI